MLAWRRNEEGDLRGVSANDNPWEVGKEGGVRGGLEGEEAIRWREERYDRQTGSTWMYELTWEEYSIAVQNANSAPDPTKCTLSEGRNAKKS